MQAIRLAILLFLESCYSRGFGNRDRAFAVAVQHCHIWGRLARVTGQPDPGGALSFECVPP
jgi:hypothetical protein